MNRGINIIPLKHTCPVSLVPAQRGGQQWQVPSEGRKLPPSSVWTPHGVKLDATTFFECAGSKVYRVYTIIQCQLVFTLLEMFDHFRSFSEGLPGVHPSCPPLHLRLGCWCCWLGCWCCWLRRFCCWLGHWRWHGWWTGGYLSQKAIEGWCMKEAPLLRIRFQVSRKWWNVPGLCFDINIPNGFRAVQNGRMFNELLFKCYKIVHI